MKNVYMVKVAFEQFVQADNEEEAMERFWEMIEETNQTAQTYMTDYMTINLVINKNDMSDD